MYNTELEIVQQRIKYEFKNIDLLIAALTHSSYVNENVAVGNERIEFLGDCVLNFLVGESLFKRYPTASEGALSAKRAATVSRAPLAKIVDSLGLMEFLQVGCGVDKASFRDKARSDIYEAIVGAVYLDGGLDACRKLLEDTFFDKVESERNYKSELQEYSAARKLTIEYGEPIDRGGVFETVVTVDGQTYSGSGKTKHESEISAAKAAITALANNVEE